MGLEFINRVIKTTIVLAVVIALFGSVYYDWRESAGLLVGAVWGAINLFFLKGIIKEVITPETGRKNVALIMAAVKFPLLYFVGYLILASEYFSVISLMAGFTLIFIVTLLKALGRIILKMDPAGLKNKRAEENS